MKSVGLNISDLFHTEKDFLFCKLIQFVFTSKRCDSYTHYVSKPHLWINFNTESEFDVI